MTRLGTGAVPPGSQAGRTRPHVLSAIPPALLEAAGSHVGEPQVAEDLSWDHAESAVWRVSGDRRSVVLKVHRQRRKFDQELTAYREWLPMLGSAGLDVLTPELLASSDGTVRGLILTVVPGQPAEGVRLGRRAELKLHTRAGAFLRRLHDLPLADDDPVELAEAYRRRLEGWTTRVEGIVPPPVIARVTDEMRRAVPVLSGSRRVRCHRDFTPRNWLVDPDGGLAVIDFEHARADLHLIDFQRLWTGLWRHEPELRDAFLAGYGRDLTEGEEELLRRLSAFAAMSTVGWAREHGDQAFERQGWEVLDWLGLLR